MRNIQTILLAVVLCVFCSCSDRGEDISGRRYPILFGSTDTRAVANLADLQVNGFKVYAHFEGNLGSASFSDVVEYNEDKKVWGFQTPQYWIPSTKYWFTAFYPKVSSAGTVNVKEEEGNYHSYTITKFDIRKQEDIMVAQAYREVGEGADAPTQGNVVQLNFQHLLACVVLKIDAEVNVTVNDISLKYMPVVCDYSNNSWLAASEQGNIDMAGINAPLTPESEPAEISFLVFPQTTNGVKLDVKTSDKTYKDIVIPDVTWLAGTKYTYTMTIKQNDILFDEPSVEEWDEESATGSVVIK